MSKKQNAIKLTSHERQELEMFVIRGKKSAREITRARILLLTQDGRRVTDIAQTLGVSRGTIYNVYTRYQQKTARTPLMAVLKEAPRSGRPLTLDSRVEAKVTMIACSEPPPGRARWTLHLIADKLVQLGVAEAISHESVRQLLKNRLKPWLTEQWCIGQITGDYLWHMEDVLHQYQLPYDPRYPLLCFDERPCFLIEEVGALLPMSPGRAKRYHYEYQRNGSCCVFLAFEPHTGFRYVEVKERRTAVDYAAFMQNLLTRYYPQAHSLRLVQDNLNTHTPGSFYEVLPPAQAFALAQRFAPHYTPKKGSWLNQAEIEFAALSTQCLDRRVPDLPSLRREVLAWAEQRNQARTTVNWKFSQDKARQKLHRHYTNVRKFT